MAEINKDGTRRELTNLNVQMIALGGSIGTGLFLGSGNTIHRTGPSILFVYLIVGILFFFMLRAIGTRISQPKHEVFDESFKSRHSRQQRFVFCFIHAVCANA